MNVYEYQYTEYCYVLQNSPDGSFEGVTEGYNVGFAIGEKLTKRINSKLICMKKKTQQVEHKDVKI